ncbi:MAG TPA: hypothetical protein VFJ70_10500 [Burkholderiales bacterium]|nr:hypothetical protein [Burkholderiales bacterium]
MKGTITLLLVSGAALVGCTTRVIERPVPSAPSVVTTPAISERVVERGQAASGSTAPAACTWASQSYSSGAISCQESAQYRCNNGTWERTGLGC